MAVLPEGLSYAYLLSQRFLAPDDYSDVDQLDAFSDDDADETEEEDNNHDAWSTYLVYDDVSASDIDE